MKHIKLLSLILVLSLLFASVVFANELGADNLFDEEITSVQNEIDQTKQAIQTAPNIVNEQFKEAVDSWKQALIGMELHIKKLQEYKANVINVGDEDTIRSYLEDVVGINLSGSDALSVPDAVSGPGFFQSFFPFHGIVVSKRIEDEHGLFVVSGMDDNVGNKKADYIFEPNQVDDFIKLLEDIVKDSTIVTVGLDTRGGAYYPIYQEFKEEYMGPATVHFEEGRAAARYVFLNYNEFVIWTTKQYGDKYAGAPWIHDRIVVKIQDISTPTPEENEITEQKPDPEPTPDPSSEPEEPTEPDVPDEPQDPQNPETPDNPEDKPDTPIIPIIVGGALLLLGISSVIIKKRVKTFAINDSGTRFLKLIAYKIKDNTLIINIKSVIGMMVEDEKLKIDIPVKIINQVLENADKERFIVLMKDETEFTRVKIENPDPKQKVYSVIIKISK